MRKYTIDIADFTGHTSIADQSLASAVDTIIEKAETGGHFVWIDGQPFEFNSGEVKTEANKQKLAARLEAAQDPTVVMSGILVGGKSI
jgi:hypothetical protein